LKRSIMKLTAVILTISLMLGLTVFAQEPQPQPDISVIDDPGASEGAESAGEGTAAEDGSTEADLAWLNELMQEAGASEGVESAGEGTAAEDGNTEADLEWLNELMQEAGTSEGAKSEGEDTAAESDGTAAGASEGSSAGSSGGESGEYGSPWVNSVDAGNLPDEVPGAADNLMLHYTYDILAEYQNGEEYHGMEATNKEVKDFMTAYIQDESHDSSEIQQLRIFFEQGADYAAMKEAGLSELQPYLDMVEQAQSVEELNAVLTSDDFPFNPWLNLPVGAVAQDRNENNHIILEPALMFVDMMMEENLADSDDPTIQMFRQIILMMRGMSITDALAALGVPDEENSAVLTDMLDIEKSYGAYLNLNDVKYQEYGVYADSLTIYSYEELEQNFPSFPAAGIIARFGKDKAQGYAVQCREWLEALNGLWTEDHLDLLKQMTQCKIIIECRNMLDPDIFQVSRAALQEPDIEPADNAYKVCDKLNTFSQLIAKIYAEECLGNETAERLTDMTANLITTYKQLIEKTGWLGEESRQKALDKLDNMKLNILYPEGGYFSYEDLVLTPSQEGGTIIGNYLKLKEYLNAKEVELLDQPALCCVAWHLLSPTISNAFYSEFDNSINIIPGIITSNVYRSDMSDEEMLGGIGYVIGHEISHGFDFRGSQMDHYGRPGSIFTDEDANAFLKICDDLAAYYDTIEYMPGKYVDGKRVNVEAAADLSGMQAVMAYAQTYPEFNYEKLFEQASIIFANAGPAGTSYMYVIVDSHPLAYLRVNVNAQMFDAMYDCYGVQEGDGMYLAPENRICFWGTR